MHLSGVSKSWLKPEFTRLIILTSADNWEMLSIRLTSLQVRILHSLFETTISWSINW